jgi:hypothetical protein
MTNSKDEVRQMLRRFIAGEDISIDLAGRMGVALDSLFPEDDRFEDLILALASYQPGGGEYLYSYESILPLCRAGLMDLESMP